MSPASECRSRAERLAEGAARLGLPLSAQASDRLLAFLDLLAHWGRAYNLTAVRDPDLMLVLHLLDSLAVSPYLLGPRVLDLGTGAGLPGVPLAILRPELCFVLLDGNGKKIRFVRQAVLELGLGNCLPIHSRIESYRADAKFSTITARAVSSIGDLRALTVGLLARPGRLLLMKGRRPDEELAGLAGSGAEQGTESHIHRLDVPFLDAERHLIEFRLE